MTVHPDSPAEWWLSPHYLAAVECARDALAGAIPVSPLLAVYALYGIADVLQDLNSPASRDQPTPAELDQTGTEVYQRVTADLGPEAWHRWQHLQRRLDVLFPAPRPYDTRNVAYQAMIQRYAREIHAGNPDSAITKGMIAAIATALYAARADRELTPQTAPRGYAELSRQIDDDTLACLHTHFHEETDDGGPEQPEPGVTPGGGGDAQARPGSD